MKVLIAVSELSPFASSGELAQRAEDLLCNSSGVVDVECVMPLYSVIDENVYNLKPTGKGFQVPVADKLENAEIWEGIHPVCNVKVWFIASRYFERDGLYGNITGDYPDNSERFVFFSRAVLELANVISKPDIILSNDWQTALIPLYMTEVYQKNGLMKNVKTALFIHDIRFQGRFWLYDLYILNLGWEVFSPEKLEFYNDINFLKGGIVYSDAIIAMNEDYLQKICSQTEGCGLHGIINKYQDKIIPVCEGCSALSKEKMKEGGYSERLKEIYMSVANSKQSSTKEQ